MMSFFERLGNNMTKTELINRMIRLTRIHCSQVAELQFYGEEGPFLFAMDEEDGKPKFFCFSFADADEFLSQPAALPAALQDPDFPFVLADALDLDHLFGSGELYQLTFNKVIPDVPACRAALPALHQADANAFRVVALLSDTDGLLPATFACRDQTLLS